MTTFVATATEKDTFDLIILSGFSMFSWYGYNETNQPAKVAFDTFHEDRTTSDRAAGWEITYQMEDPYKDGEIEVKINHAAIVVACWKMIGDDRPDHVTDGAVRAARDLLYDVDSADFDAGTADEVIQVIAYGHPEFG